MITLTRDGPSVPRMSSASSSGGTASSTSTRRIAISSRNDAKVTGEQAKCQAEQYGDDRPGAGHHENIPGAGQDAAEDIAAELVGAEDMLARGRLQAFRELLLRIGIGRDRRCRRRPGTRKKPTIAIPMSVAG